MKKEKVMGKYKIHKSVLALALALTVLCAGSLSLSNVTAYAEEEVSAGTGQPETAEPDPTEVVETREVTGVDEEGNVYVVEDTEDPVIRETGPAQRSRSAGGLKIVNFRANASGQAVPGGQTTSYTEYGTGASGYLYAYSGADGAYLGTENGKVKFMISGIVGLVDAAKVQVVNLNSVKSYSRYYVNGGKIYHQVTTNLNAASYASSVTVGPQQSYMTNGATYYSYDGHYFYRDYGTMISDYQRNTRGNAINPDTPYYNYFQYLPLRGLSSYTASQLTSILDSRTIDSSKLRGTGQTFVENQNSYGVNALLMASVGVVESGWGTSSICQQKNNLFGLNAVDSSPGASANAFSSVSQCIKEFAERWMSRQYLNPKNYVYHGGYLGDKASGINVSYASDPYWGEKIAAIAWQLDQSGGSQDQYACTIGIKDTVTTSHTQLNVRKEANTSSNILYTTGSGSNYAFLVLGESGGFYKVQSDGVLNDSRTAINSSSGSYRAASMYAYVSKDYVSVVTNGTGGVPTTPTTQSISYSVHAQTYGWLNTVSDGNVAGTEGQSKRAEAIKVQLVNPKYSGSVQYRTHVQTYGWQDWAADGAVSGTEGLYKRMEAIQIRLTGEMEAHYDVYYRVHSQTYGWLDWAKNGEMAGTTDGSKRMEAIQVVLVEKGGNAPGETARPFVQPVYEYNTHVQTYGWRGYTSGGGYAGTTGLSKRMEAIQIRLLNTKYSGGIRYRTHVQTYGWQGWSSNDAISGTTGISKRMEAIQIQLTGEMAEHYDIYYRVHSQTYGWLDWAKNGESAGTEGLEKRMECIQVVLMPKGAGAPGSTERPFVK